MNIRSRLWFVIIVTTFCSGILTVWTFRAHTQLEDFQLKTSALGKRITALTAFRAASRQSLLELTEYLYTKDPINLDEYRESAVKAAKELNNLDIATKKIDMDDSSTNELIKLHQDFSKKIENFISAKYSSGSIEEKNERKELADFFLGTYLKKVATHLEAINKEFESASKQHEEVINALATKLPVSGVALTLLIVAVLFFTGNSMIKRINTLIKSISEFNIGETAVLNLSADGDDEISQIAKSYLELTSRINLTEQQLSQKQQEVIAASRLASLGSMAGGIAHEINNPLTIIDGHARKIQKLVTQKNLDEKTLSESAQKITSVVQRIAKIISGLRTFARDGAHDPTENVSIKKIMQDLLALCEERLKIKEIQIDLPPADQQEVQSVECRPTQVLQVLVNLINNSIDAIHEIKNPWIKIDIQEKSDSTLVIRVTDCGAGIASDIAAKIMDPFFTTKAVGSGTGLGLSISKGLIESMNGQLRLVEDSANTTFEIVLPTHSSATRHTA